MTDNREKSDSISRTEVEEPKFNDLWEGLYLEAFGYGSHAETTPSPKSQFITKTSSIFQQPIFYK